ncbi:MAG: imidazole glycerol phosphate synthase subunit HisH [Bacteroidales bacterium]|jgi:glutamine amidotransferase
MIGIINYGLGNIKSIQNIIRHVGGTCKILMSPEDFDGVDKLILPGVGAFDHGMTGLKEGNWIEPLDKLVLEKKVPVLGICLGMQLLCKSSEEGILPGLGWVDASVIRINFPEIPNLKIPHMGWNTIEITKPNPLFEKEVLSEQRFYFVHSYHVHCNDNQDVLATAPYGRKVTAALSRENIFGVQFHPEKSHKFGKEFFKRYIAL